MGKTQGVLEKEALALSTRNIKTLEVYAFIDTQVDEMRIGDGAPCWAGGCLLLAKYLASCICRALIYCILAN